MTLKIVVLLLALILGVTRIWSFRRRGLGPLRALGVSFDLGELRNLAVGIAISSLAIAAVFLVAHVAQSIEVQSVGPPIALLNDLGSVIGSTTVEELVFRSALLGGLLVLLPRVSWLAVACSAIVFGALHALNQHATLLAVLGSTVGGVSYGIAFAATQRISLPLGLHFGWNYAMGPIFGFPVSGSAPIHATFVHQHSVGAPWFTGGEYGPEGGLVGIVGRIIVVALVVAWVTYRRHGPGRTIGRPNKRLSWSGPIGPDDFPF